MNKYIITTLLTILFIATRTFAQRIQLLGAWTTEAGEQMIVDDPKEYRSSFLKNSAGTSKYLYLKILKDTLCFYEQHNGNKRHGKTHYDLAIVSLTDSTVILKPASILASRFFQNKSILEFSTQPFIADKSIRLEKLIYHIRGAWIPHSVYLQIEQDKSFYISSQSYRYGAARREEGNYTGVLSDSLYQELISCLQTCNLRQITFDEVEIKDSDQVTLIVYFNGIRRYLKSNNPPQITSRLFHVLESVYDDAELRPARKRVLED